MRVLLISSKSEHARGGIATWTSWYLERCGAHDIECALVNIEMLGRRAEDGTAKRNLLAEIMRTKRIFSQVSKQLSSGAFDVAHLNTSCSKFGLFRDYISALMIQRKGIPLVIHYHCDIPNYVKSPLSRWALKKLAGFSKNNFVLCENSRRYLKEQFGLESVKIPNFIMESLIISEPKVITPKLQRVFFVGHVEAAKGVAEIFELARRFPELIFELVGEVRAQVATWEKPDNVLLPGGMSHAQVIERLDAADIFLFPSHSEGFSVALMEAMARGIPAIATDVGANADMLADGCGIVVQKGDVDAMEQAIRQMYDPDTRKEISCRAVEKVRTHFTTDAVIALMKSMY